MWPGFDSQTPRQMWVEFVVGSRPCSERFFSGYSGFLLSSKTNISKFQFDLDTVDEEPYVDAPLLIPIYFPLLTEVKKGSKRVGVTFVYHFF